MRTIGRIQNGPTAPATLCSSHQSRSGGHQVETCLRSMRCVLCDKVNMSRQQMYVGAMVYHFAQSFPPAVSDLGTIDFRYGAANTFCGLHLCGHEH